MLQGCQGFWTLTWLISAEYAEYTTKHSLMTKKTVLYVHACYSCMQFFCHYICVQVTHVYCFVWDSFHLISIIYPFLSNERHD